MLPWYYAVILVATAILFFIGSCLLYIWRSRNLQTLATCETACKDKASDAIHYSETVKFFTAEDHEVARYTSSLADFKAASATCISVTAVSNFLQYALLLGGLATALILACYDIYKGKLEIGDFVMILAFLLHIYTPLTLVGNYFRQIRQGRG